MRRRNRGSAGKEKMIMVLSSVFVLTALTAMGLFFRGKSEEKSDGYVVDFSAIEQESRELAKSENAIMDNDLDYDPYYQEINSISVENEGKEENTEENTQEKEQAQGKEESNKDKEKNEKNEEGMFDESIDKADNTLEEVARMEEMENTTAIATSTSIQPALTFGDKDTLVWPVVGNVLLNYSMDKTVYFPTLEQYKYNPAIVISATEGDMITAAANGKVTGVYTDPQLGNVVVMELGNGYEITYGQLKDITVSEGGFVEQGDIIGSVAAPTKYYVIEGCNVYFKLTKDGVPVNPMTKLQ